jgi:hypothetical protein
LAINKYMYDYGCLCRSLFSFGRWSPIHVLYVTIWRQVSDTTSMQCATITTKGHSVFSYCFILSHMLSSGVTVPRASSFLLLWTLYKVNDFHNAIIIMIRLMLFIMIRLMIMFWGLPVYMANFNDKSAAPSLSRGRTLYLSPFI